VPLVVGLGNPGRRYTRTRHNAGWRVVETIVARGSLPPGPEDATYRCWRGTWDGMEIDLMTPVTYMNRSGEALEAWRDRHGLDPAALLVVTDDVYLPVGLVRLRARGSSGGHRGLESISEFLGGGDFARLRVGVGAVAAAELRSHVLEAPPADEEETYEQGIAQAADAVACWAREGIVTAMNRFNRKASKEDLAS